MPYTCPMCGIPGVAQYESEFVENAEFWSSILHCNRCADLKATVMKLTDRAVHCAVSFCTYKNTGKLTNEIEKEIREKLSVVTQEVAHASAKRFRTLNRWQYDFVNFILENPSKTEKFIRQYVVEDQKEFRQRNAQIASTAQ